MAKTKKVGVGLMEGERLVSSEEPPIGELRASMRFAKSVVGPSTKSFEERAKEFEQVLKTAELEMPWRGSRKRIRSVLIEKDELTETHRIQLLPRPDDPRLWYAWYSRMMNFKEDSLEWLAMQWLYEFYSYQRYDRLVADGHCDQETRNSLTTHTVNMGRIEERIWWRCGIDPKTGKRPEALALIGRKMSIIGKANAEMKRREHELTRRARFEIMSERIPEVGPDRAAAEASTAGLGETAAIKKQWNKAVAAGEVPRLRKKKGTQS